MIGERRSRFRLYAFVAGAVVGLGGMAVALATRSVAGVAIAIAFTTVFGIVWMGEAVLARRRGDVPTHLQGLERDQQRLVSATVNSGAACPDPRLAGVVVTHARLRQRITALYLLSLAAVAGGRVVSLQSARGWERTADLALLVLLVIAAVWEVRSIIRARRAVALNAG